MKLIASILLAGSVTGVTGLAAPDSAYQVLHVLSAARGKDVLKHVIEVDGRSGAPEPTTWRVELDDPAARGGVRELMVSGGRVVGEHTPVNSAAGSGGVIDFSKLNLDSSGAFAVVEKAAEKARVGFDNVDYTLRTGESGDGSPVWVLQMMDSGGHRVGQMTVAAVSGQVLASDLGGGGAVAETGVGSDTIAPGPVGATPQGDYTVHDTDRDNVYSGEASPGASPGAQDDGDTADSHGLRIGHRIKTALMSAGHTLRNYLTGKPLDQ